MADQLQLRGGTTNEHSTFTGALREVTVDTDKDTLIVHDAATAGGHPLLREDGSNSALSLGTAGTPSIKFTGDTNTGIYSPGADQVAISTNGQGRLFVDANGNVTVDTNTFYVDAVNNRVGVGTTSPSSLLHVNGLSRFEDYLRGNSTANKLYIADDVALTPTKKLYLDGGSNTYIYEASNDNIAVVTLGSARLYITSTGELKHLGGQAVGSPAVYFAGSAPSNSLYVQATTGNVGVGTSSPQNKLTVDTDIGIYRSSSDPTLNFSVGGTISSPTKTYRLLIDDSDSDKFQLRDGSTARLTVDGSGNVGVGTTSPGYLLDVKKTDNTTYTAPNFVNNPVARLHNDSTTTNSFASLVFRTASADNALGFIYNGTTNQADFVIANDGGVNGEERFRITADGKVGIGTSTVSQKLHIADASNPVVRLTSHSGSQNCQVDLSSVRSDTTTSKAQFRIATDNGSGPQFAMVVDESQRVGIGTTSPIRPLSVSNGGAEGFEFGPGDGAGYNLTLHYNRSTSAYIGSVNQASYHTWSAGTASEKMRLDTSGRLLVGTTSVGAGDSQYSKLQVVGNSLNNEGFFRIARNTATGSMAANDVLARMFFTDSSGGRYGQIDCFCDGTPGTNDYPGRLVFSTTADGASSPTERMYIYNEGNVYIASSSGTYTNLTLKNGPSAANSTDYFQCRDSSNTLKLVIEPDGDVKNTNNSYAAISDVKLKENIVDAGSQWEDIKALRVRNYNFKASTGHGTHKQIGVIAQELELVSPGLVQESIDTGDGPDGEHEVDLGTTTKSVNYSVLYMKAVKALQEAMERIETLEAKVAALEAN